MYYQSFVREKVGLKHLHIVAKKPEKFSGFLAKLFFLCLRGFTIIMLIILNHTLTSLLFCWQYWSFHHTLISSYSKESSVFLSYDKSLHFSSAEILTHNHSLFHTHNILTASASISWLCFRHLIAEAWVAQNWNNSNIVCVLTLMLTL